MSKDNVTRRVSIYVNGKEVENSLKGVDGEIKHVQNSLRKLVEGTEEYDKKKSELTETLGKLQERQKNYREELGLSKKAIEINENSLQGYQNQLKEVQNQMNLLDTTSEDFIKNLNELKKREDELSQKIKQTTLAVKGQEVVFKASENSLQGVEDSLRDVSKQMSVLDLSTKQGKEELKKLKITETELIEKQQQFKSEISQTNVEMKQSGEMAGGLRGSLTGLWDSLLSGDLQGAKEGISSITSGMGGLIKSSLAFIATPIGAAIAGLAGLAAGAKAMFDFNMNAEKGAQLIENLSGKTGQVVEDIRIRIQSLTDTFDVGFNELAGAVDNLVDTGVAKDELEALEKIKNGLLTAPDKNEFISSLENSAVTAKQVGLDLEEVIALKQSIEETGVNPEATFGALQKAGKNLALQTDALRTSLSQAFGSAFTDDILAKVKTGQLSTVQALDLINKKSKEVGLNQTQQAEIGAQLFGKAAQSAGGFATVLNTVSGGLNKQKQELNGNQKALDDLEKANTRLGQAQSDLFRVKGFGEIWTSIKANATDALSSILEWISDVKKDIQPLIDFVGVVFANAWEYLKMTVSSAFDFIGGILKSFSNDISTTFNFIKKIFQGDFSGALDVLKNGFKTLGNIVGDTFGKIQNKIINALKGIVDNVAPFLEAIGFDVDKIKKKLDSFKNKEVELKTIQEEEVRKKASAEELKKQKAAEAIILKEELKKQQAIRDEAAAKEAEKRKQAAEKRKAEQEKEAKEEYDKAKALADAKANLAKVQLDQYINGVRQNLNKEKELTPEILALNEDRLDTIKNAQIEFNNNELARKIADLEAKALLDGTSQEVVNAQKLALQLEYEDKNKQVQLDSQAQIDAEKKLYEEQQKAIKAEQLAIDNELELALAESKYEEDKLKQEQTQKEELARLLALYEGKKLTKTQYDDWVKAVEAKNAEIEKQRELSKLQLQLGTFSQVAGALGEMFGQSKELAIVQATISGAQAALSVWQAPAALPQPFDSIMKGIITAGVVASTIKQIGTIRNQKAPATPKFFYGGSTGSTAALGYDEFGPVTGYVHKNEYVIPEVMTQDPRFANTIGWLEANRQSKLRGYVDGGATSPGAVAQSAAASNETAQMNALLSALLNRLDNPVSPKLVVGYKDVEALNDMSTELTNSKQNGTIG